MSRQIVIVGRRAWHPRLRQDFHRLDPPRKNAASAILRYLHDLHIGVTPELAAGLARILDADSGPRSGSRSGPQGGPQSGSRAETGAWHQVFERLEEEIKPPRPDGGESRRKSKRQRFTGLIPASATFYTLARIAAPILSLALEKLDCTYLFAADAEPCPENFDQDYSRYSAELTHQLRRLASGDEISRVFWADRALSLHHLSKNGGKTNTPDVDAVALGQLLRLEPRLADLPSPRRSLPRKLTTSPRYRPLLNRNEGGVDGIFHTRRLADLPQMLKSEFIHPRPLLLERLLQSGYLALRRPPLREKQRDVMIAGVLPSAAPGSSTPGSSAPGSSASMRHGWIKAAWFDAVSRLSIWFSRAGLRRSEFLWTEADEGDRPRVSRFLLDDLPEALRQSDHPTAAYRKELLIALGWLPDFLDQHASGRGSVASDITSNSSTPDTFDWSVAAWQAGRQRWQAYDTLHLMLFLPRKMEKVRAFGGFRHALGLPVESGYSVSVTWLPETFTDLDPETGWAFSAERKPVRSLALREDTSGAGFENRLASLLIDAWLQTILEEMVRDD